jgi:hypothetical protein
MSIIAPTPHEDVELDDRKAMTPARKRRIHKARDGKCWMCGKPVPVDGPEVRYDHRLPLDLGGSDDDANIWPLHRDPCDRLKTAADQQRIWKARKQAAKHRLDREPPKTRTPLRSRGFQKTRIIP